MLYAVPVVQVVGSDFNTPAVEILDTQEQVLSVIAKGEYVNKLNDIFHCHPRRLEAMRKMGVIMWPFDTKKAKPVSFKKLLLPCDECGLA